MKDAGETARRAASRRPGGTRRSALRIVLTYAVVASTWIVVSDMVSRTMTVDPDLLTAVALAKGVLFVAVTSSLLFFQIRHDRESLHDASQRLRESEERYATLAETSPDLIYIIGPDDGVVYANEATARLLGRPLSEVMGQTRSDLFDGRVLTPMGDAIQRVFESGESVNHESRVEDPCGPMWLNTMFVPIRAADGRVMAVFGVSRDITDHKQVEHSLLRTTERLDSALRSRVETLGKVVEARDPYTQGHERGVAKLSRLIAEEMGMAGDEVAGIEVAALVHDVGKLAVPAEILTRPGKLTAIEYELIKEHSRTGHDILSAIEFDWPIADIVLQHHERADGSGYPSGLSGDEILPAARVLAVADVVEAMGSHRPYRPALGLDAAMAEITANRSKFDPDVVAACVRLHEAGAIEV